MAARKETDIEAYGPLLIGVDPAGMGADDSYCLEARTLHHED
jgi:hypothetical protein